MKYLATIGFSLVWFLANSQSLDNNNFKIYIENNNNENIFPSGISFYDSLPSKQLDFKKPVLYSMSLMTVNIALLIVTNEADNEPSWNNFADGFRNGPALDDVGWLINYVSHPIMGSETYLKAREGNFGKFGSFLFSTAMSFTWEFIFESWTERPSTQDLLFTSTTGCILGEIRYFVKGKMKPEHHWFIDPINTLFLRIKPGSENNKSVTIRVNLSF